MKSLISRKNVLIITCVVISCALGTIAAERPAANLNDPTGTQGLLMIDKLGMRVRFFDPKTNQELANVDVGIKPHEFAITPDHKIAYVTVYGDGVYGANTHPNHLIAIMDLVSHQQVGTIDVSPYIAP